MFFRSRNRDFEDINRSSDINLDVLFSVFDRINKAAAFHSHCTPRINDLEATKFGSPLSCVVPTDRVGPNHGVPARLGLRSA